MKKSEEIWRNMRKSKEKWRKMKKKKKKEEKWRKVKKNDYKTKISIDMLSETHGTHTHTQMAHGKKSWFCSHSFSKVKKNEEKSEEKWTTVEKKAEKVGEMWLQNKDVYPHAIWDAWYTQRWHMQRNLGFVATFLLCSPQCWKVKKSEEK